MTKTTKEILTEKVADLKSDLKYHEKKTDETKFLLGVFQGELAKQK